jgi:hypothetical protein
MRRRSRLPSPRRSVEPASQINVVELQSMPMRSELQISDLRLQRRAATLDGVCSFVLATLRNPELETVALFCAAGLLLTFYFMHLFPNLAAVMQSLGQIA